MSQGILAKKYKRLRKLGAISARPDAEIGKLLCDGDPETVRAYHCLIEDWIRGILTATLTYSCKKLLHDGSWPMLSNDTPAFNKQLDRYLSAIHTGMKLLHGIPDHRRSENEERDVILLRMKVENRNWSFRQIAIHYKNKTGIKITANTAERSIKATMKRVDREAKELSKAAAEYVATSALSDGQLAEQLPIPEKVIDILIDADQPH
jgi:hypothetical protein